MAKGETPFTEEMLEELARHKKIDVKRAKRKITIKDSVITNTNLPEGKSAEANIKNSIIGKKDNVKTGGDSKEEKLAKSVWLAQQKAKGKDTIATRFIEEEIKEEKEAVIENPDSGEPKKKRPAVRGSEMPLKEGEIDATDEMMAEERARIAARHGAKESNQTPKEEKPEIIEHFGSDYAEIMKENPTESGREVVKDNERAKKEAEEENELREKIDKLKNLSEDEKEKEREKLMDAEMKRMRDEYPLDELRDKNQYQEKKIAELEKENAQLKENFEKTELFMRNAENAIKKEINELPEKESGKMEKVWKFLKNPKVKLAIGLGLIGASAAATGGGALIGAWLGLPYGLGIPALGGTSNLIAMASGYGLLGAAFEQEAKKGFRKNMKDILSIMKNEKESVGSTTQAESNEQQREAEQTRQINNEQKKDGELILKQERIKKPAAILSEKEIVEKDGNNEEKKKARDKYFELAKIIGNNKEKLNTTVLERLAEMGKRGIEKGNYEIMAPMVALADELVQNKEKFDFLNKANAGKILDERDKEELVKKIKIRVLAMGNRGMLGDNPKERQKNRLAIAALLDSKEFRSGI